MKELKFRTELEPAQFDRQIDYRSGVVSVGSCFAQNMADKLIKAGFRVEANPFGVLFNPISVADCIERVAAAMPFVEEDFVSDGRRWFCYSLHGSFAGSNKAECVERANRAVERANRALVEADLVILTLGTAMVYQLEDLCATRVVANCHKQPAHLFTRRRLSVEEVVNALSSVVGGVLADKRVILTVSPVRHIGDGLAENSLSKAILRVACAELCERFGNCHYFPAYEILMDDLRDYRFYADDLCHPSAQAVEYLWRKFSRVAITEEARRGVEAAERYGRMVGHRISDVGSDAARDFVDRCSQERSRLMSEWPEMVLPEVEVE